MLTTGNQLRAARGLIAMDQTTLAELAGVNINTISAMERRGAETLTSGLDTIRSIMDVLATAGVEFLDSGVKLKPGSQMFRVHRMPHGIMEGAIKIHAATPYDAAILACDGPLIEERGGMHSLACEVFVNEGGKISRRMFYRPPGFENGNWVLPPRAAMKQV